ncbi:MAG: hypothetical protein LBQ79_11765 [Deltaproteobacteria bacterium]|nr:hypothetical protein [Deltaproteobacteria bacterium]
MANQIGRLKDVKGKKKRLKDVKGKKKKKKNKDSRTSSLNPLADDPRSKGVQKKARDLKKAGSKGKPGERSQAPQPRSNR